MTKDLLCGPSVTNPNADGHMDTQRNTMIYAVTYSDWFEIISVHRTRVGAEAALTNCKANPDKTTFKYSDYYELQEYELYD